MKRHVAKLKNTDQRCFVAFMQLPENPDKALVIPTDNLNSKVEQIVHDLVESKEAQNEVTFANVLGRRLFFNSTKTVLQVLHESNLLIPVDIDNVIMYPVPNHPVPLRTIINNITGQSNEVIKFNPHEFNVEAKTTEERMLIAKNLLTQADILQSEADAKFEEAYTYAPELKRKDNPTTLEVAAEPKEVKRRKAK